MNSDLLRQNEVGTQNVFMLELLKREQDTYGKESCTTGSFFVTLQICGGTAGPRPLGLSQCPRKATNFMINKVVSAAKG